ncbi:UNVERIFIED_CONTAM: hypothetical protein FKN15_009300 [Acipenser sinensis]
MENSDQALHSDNAEDVATSSSFRQFQLRHFHLELDVDFDKKNVSGRERLDLRCIRDSPEELVLDIHPTLLVEAVSYSPGKAGNADSIKIQHETRSFTSYGTSLVLKFPVQWKRGDEFRVDIEYTATDGPGVPEGFTAVMSATSREHRQADRTFLFSMVQPVPSYLVALAVGDLVSADVGPRYDVLFMPPSFPFGGMENPCLTFVTPCLLAGDRSLADVIVHEICHSWFGNLVTNANWGDFWLNEGFTMYAQRRVCTQIYGAAYASLEAATGRSLLRQHMDTTGEEHPLNKLRVQIKPGVDPDDTYNETPYEKGFCFVSYLAHLCGEQSRFDAFLRGYVDKFKFRSILAEDALEFYLEYFPDLKEKGVHEIAGLQFESWLNTPGWPPYLPDLSPGVTLMKPAEQLAQLWAAETLDLPAIKAVDTSSWKTYQTVYFLDKILENSPLPTGNVQQLEELYPNVSKARNAELRLRWAQIVLKNHHEPQFHQVRSFLHSQGKQKYTLPLYRAMWSGTEQTKALAMEIFSSTAKQLHSNVRSYVKRILS